MKKIIFSLLTATLVFTSCYKDDTDGVTTSTVNLTGANTVPSNTSSATGKFTFSYNANTNIVSYQLTYTGLTDSATQVGISQALPGQQLPSSTFQLFNFNKQTSPQYRLAGSFGGNFVVDGQQMKLEDLKAGKYCIYLRTEAFGNTTGGELRAQIVLP